jgi:Na+/melibiose symporter-like transporter
MNAPRAAGDPPRRLSAPRHAALSAYWFAYNLQWAALLAIVLPSQIAAIAGDARKELLTGLVTAVGALFSLVLTPLAGMLSDRSRSRWGPRRPYVLAGTLVNVAFVLLLGGLAAGTSLSFYVFAYLGVQLGSNWAGGPYAALIPDVVPGGARGAASGWMALMSTLGTLAGALLAGALVAPGHYTTIATVIAVALLAAAAITWFGVREPRRAGATAARTWGETLRTILPSPRAHGDFYWVLGTRGLVGMGIYSVFSFFQYYLGDVVRAARPEAQASLLIGVIIAAGIPSSLVAGARSDRVGRKPLVYWSGGVMAVASIAFIGAAVWPSLGWVFAVGALFGVGYGAYQAVDWALAVDVLPPGDGAAKDMGIWHVALVLPQVLAPGISGAILAALKPVSLVGGYVLVFALAALWFVLGTALVTRVRGAR